MNKRYVPKERTSDAIKDGFDSDPAHKTVSDTDVLVVYRAHGGRSSGSSLIGRFFFAPQVAGVPRLNWTAEMLERELNAALWGNDFRYLAKFQLLPGTSYKIGPIAHDCYQAVERNWNAAEKVDVPFDQYAYFRSADMFFQVEVAMSGDWRLHLKLLADEPIRPGRFHRTMGSS